MPGRKKNKCPKVSCLGGRRNKYKDNSPPFTPKSQRHSARLHQDASISPQVIYEQEMVKISEVDSHQQGSSSIQFAKKTSELTIEKNVSSGHVQDETSGARIKFVKTSSSVEGSSSSDKQALIDLEFDPRSDEAQADTFLPPEIPILEPLIPLTTTPTDGLFRDNKTWYQQHGEVPENTKAPWKADSDDSISSDSMELIVKKLKKNGMLIKPTHYNKDKVLPKVTLPSDNPPPIAIVASRHMGPVICGVAGGPQEATDTEIEPESKKTSNFMKFEEGFIQRGDNCDIPKVKFLAPLEEMKVKITYVSNDVINMKESKELSEEPNLIITYSNQTPNWKKNFSNARIAPNDNSWSTIHASSKTQPALGGDTAWYHFPSDVETASENLAMSVIFDQKQLPLNTALPAGGGSDYTDPFLETTVEVAGKKEETRDIQARVEPAY